MSMHKIPLTQIEEAGLRAHGLDIGTPSQLSDVFRQGVAWGQERLRAESKTARVEAECLAASCKSVTEQLAAANGWVEMMRRQIVAAHPYIWLHNPAKGILEAALTDLPEADAITATPQPQDVYDIPDFLRNPKHLADERKASAGDGLDERMKAAGMLTVDEILAGTPLEKWIAHASVVDLTSFGEWLEMRRREMLSMQADFELNGKKDDDLYEWIVSHVAVFTEAHVNFKKAMTTAPQPVTPPSA